MEERSDMQRLADELTRMAKDTYGADQMALLEAADYLPQLWDAGFRSGRTSGLAEASATGAVDTFAAHYNRHPPTPEGS